MGITVFTLNTEQIWNWFLTIQLFIRNEMASFWVCEYYWLMHTWYGIFICCFINQYKTCHQHITTVDVVETKALRHVFPSMTAIKRYLSMIYMKVLVTKRVLYFYQVSLNYYFLKLIIYIIVIEKTQNPLISLSIGLYMFFLYCLCFLILIFTRLQWICLTAKMKLVKFL